MRKAIVIYFLLALLILPTACGCAEKKETSKYTESEQRLEGMYEACQEIKLVDGGKSKGTIKASELKDLGEVTVDAVLTRSNGMKKQGNWTGTSLSKVLEHYGVAFPFKELKVKAWDGYVGRVDYETAMLEDTILARLENGKKIQKIDGPVRLVVASKDGFFWVRMLTEIEVLR